MNVTRFGTVGLALLAVGGCALPTWPFKKEPTAAESLRSPGVGQPAPEKSGGLFTAIWPGQEVTPEGGPPKAYLDADDPLNPTGEATVPPSVFVQQAEIAEAKGDAAAAVASYEQALKADPAFTAAHLGLARLHDRAGDTAAAIGAYKAAIESDPDNPSCHNDFGTFLARQQDYPTAALAFGRATELEPTNVLYRNNLAVALVAQGAPEEALRELADVHPPAVAHYNLAYLLKEQRQLAGARTHALEAVKLDPTLEPARKLLASLDGQAGPTTAARPDGPATRVASNPAGPTAPTGPAAGGLVGRSGTVHDPTRAAVVGGEIPLETRTMPLGGGTSTPDWATLPGTAGDPAASHPTTSGPTTSGPSTRPSGPATSAPAADQAPATQPDSLPPWLRSARADAPGSPLTAAAGPAIGPPSSTTRRVSYQAPDTGFAPVVPLQ